MVPYLAGARRNRGRGRGAFQLPTTTLHALTFHNTSGSSSPGLVRFGLAFEDGDVPAGAIPRAREAGGGDDYRSWPIEIATYSSGAMRKCTFVADIGSVDGSSAKAIEVYAKIGAVAASGLVPATYLTGRTDDETVEIRNHTGFTDNTNVGNIDFSLKTAVATATRCETQADTDLFVRYFAWQLVGSDVHLNCLYYVDIWLDTDGETPLAFEWAPALSQHWLVNDPLGSEMTKQRRTYDATVKVGSTTIDTRTSLSHACHCRWASLRPDNDAQHGRKHWVAESVAMPTLRVEYSLASRKKMARAGYLPPFDWSLTPEARAAFTYVPLGANGHRAAIGSGGGYAGRGAVSILDGEAMVLQSADSWRCARVAAQAGLSVYFHAFDHRVIDDEPGMRLIPQPFTTQLGAKSYSQLGDEIAHGRAASGWTLLADTATGGTGSFSAYDTAHHCNYSGMMAFIEGERYLFDAVLSSYEMAMSNIDNNSFGHNPERIYYQYPARQAAFSIPSTKYGTMPYVYGQPRMEGWSINAMFWAWGLCEDDDPHREYIQNALINLSQWYKDSYDYFPAGHLAWGGSFERLIGSPWQVAWTSICAHPWVDAWEDKASADPGGLRMAAAQSAKIAANIHASGRFYASDAYRNVWPCDTDYLNWIDGETDVFTHFMPTYADGLFTIGTTPLAGTTTDLEWSTNDKVLFWNRNDSASTSGITLPDGFSYGTIYYMRDISGGTCRLSATPGGAAITSSGSGTASIGVSCADFTHAVAGEDGRLLPGADSYVAIQAASAAAAQLRGAVSATVGGDWLNFVSNVARDEWMPWALNGDQS